MEKDYFDLENRNCMAYYQDHPKILLIQPVDEHDLKVLDRPAELIVSGVKIPFLLAAFRVSDWNRELSPWPAPAVFGKNDFGDGAPETLRFIESRLLPFLLDRFGLSAEMPLIPGGYSLAGLFAAREALGKALGTGIDFDLKEAEVCHTGSGAPFFRVSGLLKERIGNSRLFLSISHDNGIAAAVCLLEGDLPE